MSNALNIEKLTDDNYETWSTLMKSVLIHQQLWSVVEKPDEKATDFVSNDQRALALITLSIQPKNFRLVKMSKSAKEAWLALEKAHIKTGPASIVSCFKKLVTLRIRQSQPMQEHIDSFVELSDQLATLDIKLPELCLSVLLLLSLGEAYENFVVAMSSRDSLPPVAVLKIKLLEEEERKSGDAVTSHVLKLSRGEKVDKRKRRFKCFKCSEIGHKANECPLKKGDKQKYDNVLQLRSFSGDKMDKSTWILDSGATSHVCCDRSYFSRLERSTGRSVALADERKLDAYGVGEVKLNINGKIITLTDVLFITELEVNYFSVARAVEHGCQVIFGDRIAKVLNSRRCHLVTFKAVNNLFVKRIEQSRLARLDGCHSGKVDVGLLHRRLGHLNIGDIEKLIRCGAVEGVTTDTSEFIQCDTCLKCKASQLPYHSSSTRTTKRLELVHSDLCGPIKTPSLGGARYFLTFVDDYSRFVWVYMLKFKDEAVDMFKSWHSEVERQSGEKVKTLRTDNGCEYLKLKQYFKTRGMRHETSVAYTPQQNGVAERVNRTLVEMSRSCLSDGSMDLRLWAEAVSFSAYIRNRVINKNNEKVTPFELWSGRKPNLSHLRVFGSKGFVLDKRTGKHKFAEKGKEMILVGYGDTKKAYRMLDLETKHVEYSRDVSFIEPINRSVSYSSTSKDQESPISFDLNDIKEEVNSDKEDVTTIPDDQPVIDEDTRNVDNEASLTSTCDDSNMPTSQTKRGRGRPRKGTEAPKKIQEQSSHIYNTRTQVRRSTSDVLSSIKENSIPIPKDVREALSSENSGEWMRAMEVEMASIRKNKTWDLRKLPPNRRSIGSRWVFAVKHNKDGTVDKFKARLVARGFSQRFGIDYNQTFSPTVRPESLRLLFALAVQEGWIVHQVDVSTAYLNGDLEEEIYMEQPDGFVNEDKPDYVCYLNKSIYGLKQSGRQWNLKLHSILTSIGLRRCEAEHCLYTGQLNNREVLLAVYVDDLLIAASEEVTINKIKELLAREVEISDKGPARYILGIEISRMSIDQICLSQSYAITKLLEAQQMSDCKPISTAMEANVDLETCNGDCEKVEGSRYRSLIGSLLHISLNTRPDITFAVNRLAQFNQQPHIEHWKAARRILRYLKGTSETNLEFNRTSDKSLVGYVDADWATDKGDRRSYTGYIFKLSNASLSWSSRKQNLVAQSSAEAEYAAISEAVNEAVYLKQLIGEVGFIGIVEKPIVLFYVNDNTSAIKLCDNPVFHKRTKHI